MGNKRSVRTWHARRLETLPNALPEHFYTAATLLRSWGDDVIGEHLTAEERALWRRWFPNHPLGLRAHVRLMAEVLYIRSLRGDRDGNGHEGTAREDQDG